MKAVKKPSTAFYSVKRVDVILGFSMRVIQASQQRLLLFVLKSRAKENPHGTGSM